MFQTPKARQGTYFQPLDGVTLNILKLANYNLPVGEINYYVFSHQVTSEYANEWISVEPTLTVPDLADTVEQMLARRAAGLPAPQSTLLRQHFYPTDPHSIQTAGKMLADLTDNLKQEAANIDAQIKLNEKQKADREALEKAEKERYQKFLSSEGK